MADEEKKEEQQQEEQEQQQEQQKEERTFTQEELNNILAKEKGKEASRVLKELGVEDVKKGKEALEQLTEWQKQRMSKEDLLAQEKEEATAKATAAEKRAAMAETKLAAVKLGVSSEYLEDVMKLLPEGEEPVEDRLKEFLDKRPMYLKAKAGDIGGKTNQPGGKDPEKDAKARLRESMGLPT